MDGSSRGDSLLSWGLSLGLHTVLLLGAAVMAFERWGPVGHAGDSELARSIGNRGGGLFRIERRQDLFCAGAPAPDRGTVHCCDGPPEEVEAIDFQHEALYCSSGRLWMSRLTAQTQDRAAYAQRLQSLRYGRALLPSFRICSNCDERHSRSLDLDPRCPECIRRSRGMPGDR